MDANTFIDIVNNNQIQHYATHPAFNDVTFATARAEDKGETVEVTGCWINVRYDSPIDYDTINILKADIPKWELSPKYVSKRQNA